MTVPTYACQHDIAAFTQKDIAYFDAIINQAHTQKIASDWLTALENVKSNLQK